MAARQPPRSAVHVRWVRSRRALPLDGYHELRQHHHVDLDLLISSSWTKTPSKVFTLMVAPRRLLSFWRSLRS